MTRKGTFILAGVAVAALGLAAAGAIAHRGGDWGHHGWRHHGGPAGLMGFGGDFAGPMGRFCRGDATEMADHMIVRIEHKVKPTDAQKGPFEELKSAARAAAEKMRAGCPKESQADAAKDGAKTPPTPIERLDRAQARLEAALDALKTVRPAAEKFYAALSDEQKAKLTERRGRGHWNRGDRRRPGGEAPGPDSEPGAPSAPQQD